tara:strand:- start:62393 stop:63148 length:756 start_codon:yes stop_codon:yes gene_type:complete
MGKPIDHGWLKDPNVKRLGHGGQPPDGHVRRCQGINRYLTEKNGKPTQCGRWALKERNYCTRHGGSQRRYKKSVAARRWYSKHAGDALRGKLDEMRDAPPDERISLESEIDMARVLAIQSVAIFDKVCVQNETGTSTHEQAAVLRAQATIACRDAMAFVAGIVDKAARVRSVSDGTIDVELVGYIVHQVQAVIERHITPLEGGKALVDKIAEDLNDIRMPSAQHGEKSADERAADIRNSLKGMDLSVQGQR